MRSYTIPMTEQQLDNMHIMPARASGGLGKNLIPDFLDPVLAEEGVFEENSPFYLACSLLVQHFQIHWQGGSGARGSFHRMPVMAWGNACRTYCGGGDCVVV